MKSLIYIVFPEYAPELTKIGIWGMLFIGPLFWTYTNGIAKGLKTSSSHFILGFLSIPVILFLDNQNIHTFYLFSLLHMLTYLVVAFRTMARGPAHLKADTAFNWMIQLTAALFIIWVGFVLQAFVHDVRWYVIITSLEVLTFFSICLIGMFNSVRVSKPICAFEGNNDLLTLANKANEILTSNRLYLNSNLTLDSLAKKVGASRHELSFAFNHSLKKSFPKLLNEVRINHSKDILRYDAGRALSIEAIAYESGFNSLSTFYKNFKRATGITPAEFREKALIESGI